MESKELEAYLARLEKSLGTISVSEKAEIIMEIKSHVIDAVERNESVSEVLSSLGEPEQVASKYLLEKGLELQKPPKHPVVKWLVIGFLGTLGIAMLGTVALVWNFSPLIKVDEKAGRVQILGGMIDVNSDENSIQINGSELKGMKMIKIEGEVNIAEKKINEIIIGTSNGKMKIDKVEGQNIRYKCKIVGDHEIDTADNSSKFRLEFVEAAAADCDLEVPKNIDIKAKSTNGKYTFNSLENNVALELMNGKVKFRPGENVEYKYDISVVNGKVDQFVNSTSENAYEVSINVVNGKITQ